VSISISIFAATTGWLLRVWPGDSFLPDDGGRWEEVLFGQEIGLNAVGFAVSICFGIGIDIVGNRALREVNWPRRSVRILTVSLGVVLGALMFTPRVIEPAQTSLAVVGVYLVARAISHHYEPNQ
jgi:hypothetical protein